MKIRETIANPKGFIAKQILSVSTKENVSRRVLRTLILILECKELIYGKN